MAAVTYGNDPLSTTINTPFDATICMLNNIVVYTDYDDQTIAFIHPTTGILYAYSLGMIGNPRMIVDSYEGLGAVILELGNDAYGLHMFNLGDSSDTAVVRVAGATSATPAPPINNSPTLVDQPAGSVTLGDVLGLVVKPDTGRIYMIESAPVASIKERSGPSLISPTQDLHSLVCCSLACEMLFPPEAKACRWI